MYVYCVNSWLDFWPTRSNHITRQVKTGVVSMYTVHLCKEAIACNEVNLPDLEFFSAFAEVCSF